jgi:hypothetical protein
MNTTVPLWTMTDEELYADKGRGRIKREDRPTDLEPSSTRYAHKPPTPRELRKETLMLLWCEDPTPTTCKWCGKKVRVYGGKRYRFDLCEKSFNAALNAALNALYDAGRKPWHVH